MSINYFLVSTDPGGPKEDWQVTERLMGTQHFTAGKKTFTFVIPISDFIRACIYDYADDWHIRIEGTGVKLSLEKFNNDIIYNCDLVIWDNGC